MSKEKQIEEIKNFVLSIDVYNTPQCKECTKWYNEGCDDVCFATKFAQDLYNAGYRKIVMCKDCAHYSHGQCYVTNRSPLFKYNVNIHSRKEDDFCSYGEMKGGE